MQLADQQLTTAEKMDQMVLVQRNSSGDITAIFNDENYFYYRVTKDLQLT